MGRGNSREGARRDRATKGVDEGGDNAGAAGADGVAEDDGAATHVHLGGVEPEDALVRDRHHGERLSD
jgi:hypothetical protein